MSATLIAASDSSDKKEVNVDDLVLNESSRREKNKLSLCVLTLNGTSMSATLIASMDSSQEKEVDVDHLVLYESPPKEKYNSVSHCCQSTSQLAALFDDFMEFGSVGLHIVDHNGIILWANQAELNLLGYTEEEYFGKPIAGFHVDQAKIGEILSILLSGEKLKGCIAPIRCKDGHTEYMEINSSMRQENGKLVTTRCFSACVTDRILREQEETLTKQKEAELIREETEKKTRFLRKLCHELRNPLAGMSGNLELLLTELQAADSTTGGASASPTRTAEERLANMQQHVRAALEYAEYAHFAAEHQALVINDTLSLSRLQSTEFDFSPKPVDFANVLTGVTAILNVKAKEKGIEVNVELSDEARFVRTDIVWVKQVIINLLSNSLKFTESGRVDIRVAVLKKDKEAITLEIAVQDTGIGMTEEEQGKLFGVFSQANEMVSAKFGGSGLGLHIIKQLLDHIGGSICAESEKGVGSTFVFTLPCGVLTAEEIASFLPKTKPDNGASVFLPLPSAKGMRVLVVDDIHINRKCISSFLCKRGYAYELAENGQIALELHHQSPFDMILTDIDMPVMNGIEMTRKLRQLEKASSDLSPVPIIGISGNVLAEDVKSARRAGINEYLGKPFNFPELDAVMLSYLAE
jgi:PAS domain S-box-containing protein